MNQLFSKRVDPTVRLGCFITVSLVLLLWVALAGFTSSSWVSGRHVAVTQPIPFGHRHHAGELNIDCRYCHDTVETSARAGLPSTQTCMTCHSQLYVDEAVTAPIRQSWVKDEPIRWKRVVELPDFVYFAHNIHVKNGVACAECHGRVDQMPLISQEHHYTMAWCLECHREPSGRLRPREAVFEPEWSPAEQEKAAVAEHLMKTYDIKLTRLTECTSCHR